jgi:carboxylesterase type B
MLTRSTSFRYGSPSLNLYDGRALALTGNVIVVNINYRVGPFGYLYLNHPDAPGNLGMLDQVSGFASLHRFIFILATCAAMDPGQYRG